MPFTGNISPRRRCERTLIEWRARPDVLLITPRLEMRRDVATGRIRTVTRRPGSLSSQPGSVEVMRGT